MPLRDLEEFAVGEPIPAPAASERLGLAERGRDDVLATTFGGPVHPVRAFADLFTTEADLVDAGAVVLTRDDPAAKPPVEADLVAVLRKELAAALYAGSGFCARLG
jgi:hypothetical protein